jgi:hypothetical protein
MLAARLNGVGADESLEMREQKPRRAGIRRGDDETARLRRLADQEAQGADALMNLDPNRLMRPDAVAEAYWQLYRQPKDAWTFELEIRSFGEGGEYHGQG